MPQLICYSTILTALIFAGLIVLLRILVRDRATPAQPSQPETQPYLRTPRQDGRLPCIRIAQARATMRPSNAETLPEPAPTSIDTDDANLALDLHAALTQSLRDIGC